MALIHHSFSDPISCYVDHNVTQNYESEQKWIKCQIIGVSSYRGCYPTFTVLIEGKYLFSNVPIHSLAPTKNGSFFTMEDAYFEKVGSPKFVVTVYKHLVNQNIHVLDKISKTMFPADYLFTIDWYENNICLNFVANKNGFLFKPNHKMIVTDNSLDVLPAYKKLRVDFK